MEARCFESDIKITESRHGKSVRLVRTGTLISTVNACGGVAWVGSSLRHCVFSCLGTRWK